MEDWQEEWEVKKKLENIIDSNIKYVPYEGHEIDEDNMVEELYNYIKELTGGTKL